VLLESLTYRYKGHGVSDRVYNKRAEEMQSFQARDPLGVMRSALSERFPGIALELDVLDARADETVKAAVQFAETSADPTAEDLTRHIYV
jgi:pyruvate dehydrogenase E1 component alpha subunit